MTNPKHIAILSEVIGNSVDNIMKYKDDLTQAEALAAMQKVEEECSPKWISVKKERPEIAEVVNVLLNQQLKSNEVSCGSRAHGGWYLFRMNEAGKVFIPNGVPDITITHWMPLPTAPAEKGEDPTKDTPVVDLEPQKGADR